MCIFVCYREKKKHKNNDLNLAKWHVKKFTLDLSLVQKHMETRNAFALVLALALAHARRDTLDCSAEGSFIRSYPSFIQG